MAAELFDLNISCVRSDKNVPWTPRDCTVTKTKQLSQGTARKGFFGLFGSRGSTPAAASVEDEEEDLTSASAPNPLAATPSSSSSSASSSIGSGPGTAITPAQRAMTAPPPVPTAKYGSTGSPAAASIANKRGFLGQLKNTVRGTKRANVVNPGLIPTTSNNSNSTFSFSPPTSRPPPSESASLLNPKSSTSVTLRGLPPGTFKGKPRLGPVSAQKSVLSPTSEEEDDDEDTNLLGARGARGARGGRRTMKRNINKRKSRKQQKKHPRRKSRKIHH